MFYLLVSCTKSPLEDLPDKAIYGVMKLLLAKVRFPEQYAKLDSLGKGYPSHKVP